MSKCDNVILYQRWCQKLYQDEAKEMYAKWLQQANDLITQDNPDADKYWEIKGQISKSEIRWENLSAPCGYWPQDMRNDSFQVSCVLHKVWQKIIRNNK